MEAKSQVRSLENGVANCPRSYRQLCYGNRISSTGRRKHKGGVFALIQMEGRKFCMGMSAIASQLSDRPPHS